jgi:hypothetical protein
VELGGPQPERDLAPVGRQGPRLGQLGLDGQVGAQAGQRREDQLEDPVAGERRDLVGIEVGRLALAGEREHAAALGGLGDSLAGDGQDQGDGQARDEAPGLDHGWPPARILRRKRRPVNGAVAGRSGSRIWARRVALATIRGPEPADARHAGEAGARAAPGAGG